MSELRVSLTVGCRRFELASLILRFIDRGCAFCQAGGLFIVWDPALGWVARPESDMLQVLSMQVLYDAIPYEGNSMLFHTKN